MLEQFGLQLFLAVHCEPVGEEHLRGDSFKNIWESMADQMAKQKQRKFWDTSSFEDLFSPEMPKQLTNQEACWITHRDDLPDSEMRDWDDQSSEEGTRRVSKLAYRLWELGDRLTEFKYIFRLSSLVDDFKRGTLLFPTHNGCIAEYRTTSDLSQISDYDARWFVNSWELGNYKDNKTFPFLFGRYVKSVADLPNKVQEHEKEEYLKDHGKEKMHPPDSVTASFSGLAKVAQGSDLIGCLRMDVDNFGDLFSGELVKSGIAALSNISRSMNLFFKGYLNEICGMNLGGLSVEDHPDSPLDITGKKTSKTDVVQIIVTYLLFTLVVTTCLLLGLGTMLPNWHLILTPASENFLVPIQGFTFPQV